MESASKLKYIGNKVFKNCNKLTSIQLPNTLEIIGNDCFEDCTNIQVIMSNETLRILNTYLENDFKFTFGLNDSFLGASNVRVISPDDTGACFSKNTLISLPYGIFKPIYQIKPGDQIINGDNQIVTVKKLQIGNYGEKTTLFNNGTKLVFIKKHAFGITPSQDTYITRSHPLYINNEFVWAESLINNDTVQWITIVDDTFYNIECKEGNTFIANGLVAGDISVCNIDYENNHSLYTKANEIISYFTLNPLIV